MSLLQRIKFEQLQARKNKDTAATALLTVLLGDASMVGKNDGNRETTDEEVIKIIKKFISNATETVNHLGELYNVDNNLEYLKIEKDLLKYFYQNNCLKKT